MDKLQNIRDLLAKAGSTSFPAEADALRAKAAQLQTKYGYTDDQIKPDPWAGIKVEYGTYDPGKTTDDIFNDIFGQARHNARRNTRARQEPREPRFTADADGNVYTYSTNDGNIPGKKDILTAIAKTYGINVRFNAQTRKLQTCVLIDATESEIMSIDVTYKATMKAARKNCSEEIKMNKSMFTDFLCGYANTLGAPSSRRQVKHMDAYVAGQRAAMK